MRISLIITTYNRPDALRAVLAGVCRQRVRPGEVIVADDGSGPDTKAVVDEAAASLPLRHVWRAHDGFRAGAMRNLALASATGDYVVMMDGDILPHPEFVADHLAIATPGYFVQGSRAILNESATGKMLEGNAAWPAFLASGIGNRKNLIHSILLSRLFSKELTDLKGIRTCNFAVWMEDAVRVNGFDENFAGWGREDSEFAARLLNAGVKRRNLRFAGLGCHLHHPPQSRERLAGNDAILARTVKEKLRRCSNGLDKYLKGAAKK